MKKYTYDLTVKKELKRLRAAAKENAPHIYDLLDDAGLILAGAGIPNIDPDYKKEIEAAAIPTVKALRVKLGLIMEQGLWQFYRGDLLKAIIDRGRAAGTQPVIIIFSANYIIGQLLNTEGKK